MCQYTDPAQKKAPAHQVGDLVILNGCNIKMHHVSQKLDNKNYSPFQIEKIVSPVTACLMLPRKWKIHNIFQVSLLDPYRMSEYQALRTPSKL